MFEYQREAKRRTGVTQNHVATYLFIEALEEEQTKYQKIASIAESNIFLGCEIPQDIFQLVYWFCTRDAEDKENTNWCHKTTVENRDSA